MTNETMKDGERAAFEAWAVTQPDFVGLLDRYSDDEYKTDITRLGLRVWIAARAASPQSGEKGEEPVARLQSRISDRPYSKGIEVFEVVILDRERACDGMDLYARAAAPQAAPTKRNGCYPSCTTAEYCDCRPVPWPHKVT